jgi:RNA polymerase sigma-70 factor (ECF subfamily)
MNPEFERFLSQRQLTHADTEDAWIVFCCLRGDPLGWATLEGSMIRPALAAARRIDSAGSTLAEVAQRVRVFLMTGSPPGLTNWSGQGKLAHWIRVVVTRTAINVVRERRPPTAPHTALEAARDLVEVSIERRILQRRYGEEFERALRVAFGSLSARERALLHLNVIERASIDSIAAAYGVHRATAARWVASIRDGLKQRTLQALEASAGLRASEANSLVRELLSQASCSIERHLRQAEG